MGCMLFPTNSQRYQSSQGIIAPLLNAYDIFTLVNYFKIFPLLLIECYLPITNRRGENCRWFGRFQPQLLSWAPSSPLVLQPGGWRDSSGQQKSERARKYGPGPRLRFVSNRASILFRHPRFEGNSRYWGEYAGVWRLRPLLKAFAAYVTNLCISSEGLWKYSICILRAIVSLWDTMQVAIVIL